MAARSWPRKPSRKRSRKLDGAVPAAELNERSAPRDRNPKPVDEPEWFRRTDGLYERAHVYLDRELNRVDRRDQADDWLQIELLRVGRGKRPFFEIRIKFSLVGQGRNHKRSLEPIRKAAHAQDELHAAWIGDRHRRPGLEPGPGKGRPACAPLPSHESTNHDEVIAEAIFDAQLRPLRGRALVVALCKPRASSLAYACISIRTRYRLIAEDRSIRR